MMGLHKVQVRNQFRIESLSTSFCRSKQYGSLFLRP
eukprot:CCRYP_003668-RA/>CCRYP_003668-RA protein AED:0.38 eAED:0.38 QI:105/1/1/1/0/0/2/0/35